MKVRVADLGNIITGNTPSKKTQEFYDSNDIGFVKPDTISDTEITLITDTNEYISEKARTKSRVVQPGAVFVTCIGTIGKIGIAYEQEFAFNQQINAIIPNDKVISKYLAYNLFSQKHRLADIANAPVVPIINKTQFSEFTIDIDEDIEKQKKIVETLDNVCHIIKARKQELQKFDELIKARFIELFGDPVSNPKNWEKLPLSDIITNANNGMARRGNDEDGNIVLRLVELQDGFIDYTKPNRIVLTDKEKKRYLLQDNDFLFARVNGNPLNVGRCAVFHDIGEEVYHNDHIIRVHFDDVRINGSFASAILNSEYGKDQMRNKIKTSAGQYTISQDGIGAIICVLPPIEFQNQFADFVQQVDKSKVVVQEALDKAQLLFDSLMQEYFG